MDKVEKAKKEFKEEYGEEPPGFIDVLAFVEVLKKEIKESGKSEERFLDENILPEVREEMRDVFTDVKKLKNWFNEESKPNDEEREELELLIENYDEKYANAYVETIEQFPLDFDEAYEGVLTLKKFYESHRLNEEVWKREKEQAEKIYRDNKTIIQNKKNAVYFQKELNKYLKEKK